MVASLAFATDVELGWDGSIKPVSACVNKKQKLDIVYDIDVHHALGTRTFTTTEIIANFGAEAMRGCGTRVWAVVDQITKETGVLKDAWGEVGRTLEGATMDTLMDGPEENPPKASRRHFYTTVCYGSVCSPTIGGTSRPDNTEDITRGVVPELPILRRRGGNTASASRSRGKGNVPLDGAGLPLPTPAPIVHHRVHSRIVYKERGTPIHDLRDLKTIWTCLKHTLIG